MSDTVNAFENKSITILVVDDDPKVVFVVSEFLQDLQFNVLTCCCGGEALKAIERQSIDLALLDIIMPDIDGFTVAKKMKEFFGKDNFVPIILLTGLTDVDDKIAGLEYADDIVSKPFSQKELLARINVMLRIRRLHHALINSRSQYQFLYENVPCMYVSIDREWIVRNCNAQFCLKNGAMKNDIIGKRIETFFPHDEHALLFKFIKSVELGAVSGGNPALTLAPLSSKSAPVSVSISGVLIALENQQFSIEIVLQDITHMVKLQQEQREARKQLYLSARLASIGTLASGVAHELNNPLTSILGFSSALLDRVCSAEPFNKTEFHQYLSIINSETLRCRDIIESLSKFAHESEVQMTTFQLHDCISAALKLIMPKAHKKKIAMTSTIAPDITANADAHKLEQVFIHVLSNCIDFCPEGCIVSISAEIRDRFVMVYIADNGPGIASEIIPKVFDPFFTTKKVGQGAGLGLAISHHIMEEFNGGIDISSGQGQGTTVVLEIPRR